MCMFVAYFDCIVSFFVLPPYHTFFYNHMIVHVYMHYSVHGNVVQYLLCSGEYIGEAWCQSWCQSG